MKSLSLEEKIEIIPLGEIRMGCDAYGIVIKTNSGNFDIFKKTPIMIGHTDHSRCIEESKCNDYLLVKGEFGTYILDIKNQSISVYKATIRTFNNEWSEEQAIYGKERTHINGFDRHYYLQFPFVKKELFPEVFAKYEALRARQIEEAVNAL